MKPSKLKIAVLMMISILGGGVVQASDVRVKKTDGQWQLIVDGKLFFAKGVGCNEAIGKHGEDYLQMAQEMGANAVRTWGDTTMAYLDEADRLNLKVAVGFWLNAVREQTPDTYQNPEHCRLLKDQIMNGIRRMKNHPAVLVWIVGVEVFSHTADPKEKAAFGTFLADVVDSIHKEDPYHPVEYGTADETDLPDLTAKVPNIDIIGIDTYGAYGEPMGWLERHHMDKPVMAIEFGPHGAWDAMKDKNGMAYDPSDALKAADYEATWHQLEATKDHCLGGFAFVLGEQRNQDSVTWWNVNLGVLHRKAFWMLYHLYTGLKPLHPVPSISEFLIEPSTGIKAGERFTVKTTAAVADGGALTYHFSIAKIFSDPLIIEPPKYMEADEKELAPGSASLKAPNQPDIYRVYVDVTDAFGNVAVTDRSLKVVSSQ